MKVIKVKNYEELSRTAATIIAGVILSKPDCILGLATGSSPVGAYKTLVDWYKKGDLDFSEVTTVNLDEYRGLTHSNDQSYYYFMNDNLFSHVNIDPAHTHIPDGTEQDAQKACDDFEAIVKNCGGTDLQLLGLGHNGHIGFNEPAEDFPKFTHCVDLTESTIQANARFFDKPEDVPTQAYTMGIGTIMRCKKILVVVSGSDKAQILKKVVQGPVTPQVPGSILQFHPDCTIIADEAALSEMDI